MADELIQKWLKDNAPEGMGFVALNRERLEAFVEQNPDATEDEIEAALMNPEHHLYPGEA